MEELIKEDEKTEQNIIDENKSTEENNDEASSIQDPLEKTPLDTILNKK